MEFMDFEIGLMKHEKNQRVLFCESLLFLCVRFGSSEDIRHRHYV